MNTSVLGVTLYLLDGFLETAKIFGVTLVIALPLGLLISFGSMSNFRVLGKFQPLAWFTKTVVWIVRGTPLMLQLIIVFYGPGLIGLEMLPVATATYLTFSINYACYFSEIFRGGIQSISRGQYEAGQVLGMSKLQTFFRVILLQVVKRVIPPMSNEIITLVKDTSIARIIGFYEIIFFAQKYIKNAGIIWPLLYTGVFYLVFTGVLTLVFRAAEKKLEYFKS